MRRPQLIAHRGAPRERPENTLPGFLRALELGADGIELDVHATRDGVVVVHHDPTVKDVAADRVRAIRELSLADVERVGADGVRIPTLAAVLDAVDDGADVYIEIKGLEIERAVVAAVDAGPAPHRCAVHSFDHRAVRRARALSPGLPGGILIASSYLADPAGALRAADARDYWAEWRWIDAELVDAVHRAGGRVIAWTPWDAGDIVHLAHLGVDGLCVDDVREAREHLERLR